MKNPKLNLSELLADNTSGNLSINLTKASNTEMRITVSVSQNFNIGAESSNVENYSSNKTFSVKGKTPAIMLSELNKVLLSNYIVEK